METNRRNFLKTVGLFACSPYVIPSSVLGQGDAVAPSNRIVMGIIGCGGRGVDDLRDFISFPQVQMIAACDPVTDHRNNAKNVIDKQYGNEDCRTFNDFREILAQDEIDAVLIATPDHWHAIITNESCKVGKDVFCEKPETLTIKEGREMAETIKKYGRVFSGGSQRVLGDYGDIPRLLWGGAIGKITEVYIACGGPSGDCDLEAQAVPPGVDWDLWLGPAPKRPFHERLINGGYRPYRDYSGGGMTDWGAHRFGAAMFATQHTLTGPTEIIPPDGKDIKHLTFIFEDGMKFYHVPDGDIVYKGTDGELPNGKHSPPEKYVDIPGYSGKGGLIGDFLDCVKTRKKPFRDIESAHRAVTICHLGNIAYWLNRPLKWDPVEEQFIGDEVANRWLQRPKRSPWG